MRCRSYRKHGQALARALPSLAFGDNHEGPSAWPDPLATKIIVSTVPCKPPIFIRWRRPHRRPRIAKKWAKRFGSIDTPCPGVAYKIGGLFGYFLVCPHCVEQLKAVAR